MSDKIDTLINIKQTSKMLGVCVDTLRKWDKSGKLKAVKTIGGHRRYKLSEIKAMQEVK